MSIHWRIRFALIALMLFAWFALAVIQNEFHGRVPCDDSNGYYFVGSVMAFLIAVFCPGEEEK